MGFGTVALAQSLDYRYPLFTDIADRVFQIQVINQASGSKSGIGSGFQISQDGLVVTNYHVVAEAIHKPDIYRVQLFKAEEPPIPLKIIRIDVINDLALVKHNAEFGAILTLADRPPNRGEDVFALGNPYDMGIVTVPGTYNGLIANRFQDRVHFTGSLNPGMSGGPALNEQGEVIGVNVATAGNQISFLVPLNKVIALINAFEGDPKPVPLKDSIGHQLHENQQRLMADLLGSTWQTQPLGDAHVPAKLTPFIKCWGDSKQGDDQALIKAEIVCRNEDIIFIEQGFSSGRVEYEFFWNEAKTLSTIRFYNEIQEIFGAMWPGNRAKKEHVTNYVCTENFVAPQDVGPVIIKAVYCSRAYRHYPDLYDVLYVGASIHAKQHALISHFTLSGVAKELAQQFTNIFLASIQWN